MYGQEIQLKHLYSNCYLTLNENTLANEPCCRELYLEETSNNFSNFKITTMNTAKILGQPILYSDTIILSSSIKENWCLGIQRINIRGIIEVNASEKSSNIKI